ncbi:MAG: mRNA surveillance protein pelota [Candidatus Altiarchaeales archaeon]|nr:mRNA surveillance protein pelota [Candidatus Altiarchaeales archaeon]MBD3416371.1 mRNA surveillance protein pelota [Candidatus Altiarchaeales archaeon]
MLFLFFIRFFVYPTAMRIERKDLRHGLVRVRSENLDDLWYLSQVIAVGDGARSKTQRRIKDKEDKRSSGGERRTITLSIKVDRKEFKSETKVLRIGGEITDGPEDLVSIGSHHTFNIEPGDTISIRKEKWGKTDLDRLEDAVKSTHRPKILVVSLDEGDAAVGLVRESRIDHYELGGNIGGKYDIKGREARKHEFYRELTQMLRNIMEKENVSHIILSGPGFEKNNYQRFLRENYGDMQGKCIVEDTGSSGRNGIHEVLKREVIHKTLEEVNSVQDLRLVEDILKNIAKDTGLSAYGFGEVADAVNAGAVETLLVTDGLFFSRREETEPLMSSVRKVRGRVHIINSEGEAGQKLDSLGGAAAKLRYAIS